MRRPARRCRRVRRRHALRVVSDAESRARTSPHRGDATVPHGATLVGHLCRRFLPSSCARRAPVPNRFRSIVVEEEEYLLELVRYIHLNPVRAHRGGRVRRRSVDRPRRAPRWTLKTGQRWTGENRPVVVPGKALTPPPTTEVGSAARVGSTYELAIAHNRQYRTSWAAPPHAVEPGCSGPVTAKQLEARLRRVSAPIGFRHETQLRSPHRWRCNEWYRRGLGRRWRWWRWRRCSRSPGKRP